MSIRTTPHIDSSVIGPCFDAVSASRKWREDAGRKLDAMSVPERIAYLEGLRSRVGIAADVTGTFALREDPAPYGGKTGGEKTQ